MCKLDLLLYTQAVRNIRAKNKVRLLFLMILSCHLSEQRRNTWRFLWHTPRNGWWRLPAAPRHFAPDPPERGRTPPLRWRFRGCSGLVADAGGVRDCGRVKRQTDGGPAPSCGGQVPNHLSKTGCEIYEPGAHKTDRMLTPTAQPEVISMMCPSTS